MAYVTYHTGRRDHLPRVRGNFYELEDGKWCASLYGWLPGYYDTLETARKAPYLSRPILDGLNKHICHVDGENRAITMADIEAAKKGTK